MTSPDAAPTPNLKPFTQYRRTQIAEMTPWQPGMSLHGISISKPDIEAGSPKAGDMIARNPKNHDDKWLVAAQYFADNFESLSESPSPIPGVKELVERLHTLRNSYSVEGGKIFRDAADMIERLAAQAGGGGEHELARLRAILDTPILEPFAEAVVSEARHQIYRWGSEHDTQKTAWDWFWTLGYLGSKAAHSALAGDLEKAKHHTVTAGALLANWHRHICDAANPQRHDRSEG